MPTAETLALALEIAERDLRDARAALVELKAEQERQRLTWHDTAMLYIQSRDKALARLARIAAGRARRDKRRAMKRATANLVARVDAALDLTTVRQVSKEGGAL